MSETSTTYVKVVVSYGKPTEMDDVGLQGMYIESVEICTKEIAQTKEVSEIAREILSDGLTVNRRRILRKALGQPQENKETEDERA